MCFHPLHPHTPPKNSYGLATFEKWSQYTNQSAMGLGVGFGVIVAVVSFLGCFGAIKQNRACLGIYLFFEFVCFVVMCLAAGLVFGYGGQIKRGDTVTGRMISNMALQSYKECCRQLQQLKEDFKYGDSTAAAEPYSAPIPVCSYNGTMPTTYGADSYLNCQFPRCADDASPTDDCAPVVSPNTPLVGQQEICTSINWIFSHQNLDEGAKCATSDEWAGTLVQFLADKMNVIGIGLAVIAGMLGLLFVASVGLCCTHKDKFDVDATA